MTKCGSGPSIFLAEMFGGNLENITDLSKGYIDKVESKPRSNKIRTRHNFSKLSYFIQCPLRYKYATIYNFHLPRSESRGFGDNIHRTLEAIHHQALEGQLPTEERAIKILKDKWITVNRTKPEQEDKFMDEANRQINRYLSEYGKTLSSIVEVETGFAFDLNGQIIQGNIDLLKRDHQDKVEIIDFKTSGMLTNYDEITKDNINLQLDIYALGAEKALGFKVSKTTAH
ncbi:MAG: PD-(D/E)XK nuclease family protein [Methanotrichaceae archaeon]|nr:PD-(D/E)XK nuclease family protein [Methanotrichaceae archaeon]